MRCPDCSKFVSMENQDPEVESLEISDNGTIDASVRLVRVCAECSTELKETTLEWEEDVTIEPEECSSPEATDKAHSLEVEEGGADVTESGGGRYAKNMIGVDLSYVITCSNKDCGLKIEGTIHEETSASSFDEMV